MGDGPGRGARGGGPALWHIRNVSRKCGRKILVPELFAIGWNIEPEGAGDSVAGGDQVDGLQTVARGSAKRCAAKGRAGYETVSWILRDSSFSGTVSLKHREVLQSSQAGSPDARRGDVFPWGKARARRWRGHRRGEPCQYPAGHLRRRRTRREAIPFAAKQDEEVPDEVSCGEY